MKKTRKILGILLGIALFMTAFSIKSFAASDYPEYFDFTDTVVRVKAGESVNLGIRAIYDFEYFTEGQKSANTYVASNCKSGNNGAVIHAGADETSTGFNIYFYALPNGNRDNDKYCTVQVVVTDLNPIYTDPAVEALKYYKGNTMQFNAYYYYVNYPDLRTNIGLNPEKLFEHYVNCGLNEKRVANKIIG